MLINLYMILIIYNFTANLKKDMKITLLGTGTSQGVPVIACDCEVCLSSNKKDNRLRSSIMVEVDDINIVIDTGPDFRQQMLREDVQEVDAVLFTHHHKDHVAGMDDVRAFNHKWKKDMPLYCNQLTSDALKLEFPYIFSGDNYPGIPKVEINIIENKTFEICGTKIKPIEVLHYKLPVFGFRIKNFVYLTDVSAISEEEKEKMKGADFIILDALRKKPHISHFNLEQALKLLEELNPKQALLTHISHYMGLNDEVNKELPAHVNLAYDGQVIYLK
jgi:phosphoribosyl 1,2-cyclic phosphate phosphodiesterase